jgi:hypothetical protein
MPRIILTTDPTTHAGDPSVLLDEHLDPIHLSTDHAAAQLIERLTWALEDASPADTVARSPRLRARRPRSIASAPRRRR